MTVDAEREHSHGRKEADVRNLDEKPMYFFHSNSNFAARPIAPFSLPVCLDCKVLCDLSSVVQMSPHISNTE